MMVQKLSKYSQKNSYKINRTIYVTTYHCCRLCYPLTNWRSDRGYRKSWSVHYYDGTLRYREASHGSIIHGVHEKFPLCCCAACVASSANDSNENRDMDTSTEYNDERGPSVTTIPENSVNARLVIRSTANFACLYLTCSKSFPIRRWSDCYWSLIEH